MWGAERREERREGVGERAEDGGAGKGVFAGRVAAMTKDSIIALLSKLLKLYSIS